MFISFDFGASTTDMAVWERGKIKNIKTFESLGLKGSNLKEYLSEMKINLKGVNKIFITGGKSRFFENKVNKIPVIKVNEIEAIGRGGFYLWENSKFKYLIPHCGTKQISNPKFQISKLLVVSMGTGTCLVKSQKLKVKRQKDNLKVKNLKNSHPQTTNYKLLTTHLGGTGVGGGTFLGLAKEILGETNIPKLIEMFKKGDQGKVDLSVGEIVGGKIGIVSADVTASNLGKLVREIDFFKADLAAGIANLIGQTIATAAIFAAKAEGIEMILLTGKLTRIQKITEIIFKVGKLYNKEVILPEKAEYVSAIGAGAGGGSSW